MSSLNGTCIMEKDYVQVPFSVKSDFSYLILISAYFNAEVEVTDYGKCNFERA